MDKHFQLIVISVIFLLAIFHTEVGCNSGEDYDYQDEAAAEVDTSKYTDEQVLEALLIVALEEEAKNKSKNHKNKQENESKDYEEPADPEEVQEVQEQPEEKPIEKSKLPQKIEFLQNEPDLENAELHIIQDIDARSNIPQNRTNVLSDRSKSPSKPAPGPAGCPPLDHESGVDISCPRFKNCLKTASPNGTTAEYRCKKHWVKPVTASAIHERICTNGEWSKRNPRWQCHLDCGEANFKGTGFVVGGYAAKAGKWPWFASFYQEDPPNSKNNTFFCGGTLISENAILTAAHCVTRRSSSEKRDDFDKIVVFLGKHFRDYKENDKNVQKRWIHEIDVHENYNPSTYDSDIALVWLKNKVNITDWVRPACLPLHDDILEPDPQNLGTIIGFGRAGSVAKREFVSELQELKIPVVGRRECQKSHPALAQLTRDSTFCAGYKNGSSACDGDSGGGLVFEDVKTLNKFRVQGIVSAGVNHYEGGCDPRFYTIFTKVVTYLQWIDDKLDTDRFTAFLDLDEKD